MKKYFILILILTFFQMLFSQKTETKKFNIMEKYIFKPLPYSYDALEPYIDARTMELHYDRHHRGYYNNFIKAMETNNYEPKPILELFAEVSKYDVSIRNMGGGYWNHEFFWDIMTNQKTEMSLELKKALERDFGSVENMIENFNKSAVSLFGSGWTWLIVNKDRKLEIVNTPNQDNPYMDVVPKKGIPILGIDVWEHAYYLKYQNLRVEYVKNFWNVVNWKRVSERYAEAIK